MSGETSWRRGSQRNGTRVEQDPSWASATDKKAAKLWGSGWRRIHWWPYGPNVRLRQSQALPFRLHPMDNDDKRLRYSLRSHLWGLSTIDRCRKCGRTRVVEKGTVALRISKDKGNGFAGLSTCGSVWVCPVCAAKVSRRRADEVAQAVQAAADRGYSASLLTLTARHHRGQRLKEVWNAVLKAWQSMLAGRFAQTFRDVLGVKHWVRVVEVTHGANGWHPHLHVILIHDGRLTADQLESALWPRWFRALERQGMTAVQGAGLDVRSSSDAVSEYLVKSLAAEVTAGHGKHGREGGRTPFQILRSVTETGDADDLALWHEWEAASRGRRQFGWSKGFRDWARLEPEQSDEQIAEEEPGGEDSHERLIDRIEDLEDRLSVHEAGDSVPFVPKYVAQRV